jgi:photosystem II stability/assembly factor-like uncharacterized protein
MRHLDPSRAVAFGSPRHGWAVSNCGVVFATSNGGASWKRQKALAGVYLGDVAFADARHGWAIGETKNDDASGRVHSSGIILHTSNGGATWKKQTLGAATPYLDALACANRSHSWIVGEALNGDSVILVTGNGGATWKAREFNRRQGFSDIAFTSASQGWVVGSSWDANGDPSGSAIRATANGGASWQAQNAGTTANLSGVAFANATDGWAVGAPYDGDGDPVGGIILATTNGGATWSTQYSGT